MCEVEGRPGITRTEAWETHIPESRERACGHAEAKRTPQRVTGAGLPGAHQRAASRERSHLEIVPTASFQCDLPACTLQVGTAPNPPPRRTPEVPREAPQVPGAAAGNAHVSRCGGKSRRPRRRAVAAPLQRAASRTPAPCAAAGGGAGAASPAYGAAGTGAGMSRSSAAPSRT